MFKIVWIKYKIIVKRYQITAYDNTAVLSRSTELNVCMKMHE